MANLGIGAEVDAAANSMERLAAAAERAVDALGKLESAGHGGITIKAVGDVVHIEIRPAV